MLINGLLSLQRPVGVVLNQLLRYHFLRLPLGGGHEGIRSALGGTAADQARAGYGADAFRCREGAMRSEYANPHYVA